MPAGPCSPRTPDRAVPYPESTEPRFQPGPTARRAGPVHTVPVALDPLAPFLEEIPGPCCLLGPPDGAVTAWNTSFADWAGRLDLTGLGLGALFPGDATLLGLWDEARGASVAVEHHVERHGRGGAASFWSLRARRTGAGVLVCATDLTSFAEAAQAVHASQRAYVAAVTHELRAPLAAIKVWAGALDGRRRPRREAEGNLPPPLDEGLGAIARQVDRMDELLSDLLEAARSEAGAVRAHRVPLGAADLVRRAIEAAPGPLAARARLGVAVEDRVLVDPLQLEAVLGRLLAYVARRSPEGPLVIDLERAPAEVLVRVPDAGPPLPALAEADLFGRRALAGRGRGAGIGLHVAQLLAAAGGARVWRERGPDGARFVVALPGEAAARAGATAEPRPLRVLVAEREEGGLLARAASVLRLFGHEVTTRSSAEGLHATLAGPAGDGAPDLVVAGALLLGAPWLGELPALRARLGPAAPVVILTAPSGERPAELALAERSGVVAVLPEPLDWTHLVALVQSVSSARAGRP